MWDEVVAAGEAQRQANSRLALNSAARELLTGDAQHHYEIR
jgi:hypothetical protein